VGVVLAKPALQSGHLVEITWTRLVAGTVVQLVLTLLTGRQADAMQAFVRRDTWKHMVPGALVGTYLSLLLWLGGFKWGQAAVASVLNQMATVYMLLLARFVLGERLRKRQVGGALLAAAGAVWIVMHK
jgi:drug/metabolite transporter (DMT)-like permease